MRGKQHGLAELYQPDSTYGLSVDSGCGIEYDLWRAPQEHHELEELFSGSVFVR